MTEVKIDLEKSIQKFTASGGENIADLEIDPKSNGELLEACIDMLYGASDGKLWNGGSMSMTSSESTMFPKGVVISFMPVPLEGDEKVGIFTFSKDIDNPSAIVSTLGIKCELTDSGHTKLHGKMASYRSHSPISMLQGITMLSVGILNESLRNKIGNK